MASGTISDASYIQDITGYTFFTKACSGGNGGDPVLCEYYITDYNDDGDGGNIIWDNNLSNGFDTGWVSVELQARAGGSAGITWSLTVGTVQSVTYTGISYGNINGIVIRAGVRTTAKSLWRNLSAKFYRSGALTDSYSASTGPQVNLSGASSPAEGQEILSISPSATTNDAVTVTGQIRFISASTSIPDVDDMLAEIFIFTA